MIPCADVWLSGHNADAGQLLMIYNCVSALLSVLYSVRSSRNAIFVHLCDEILSRAHNLHLSASGSSLSQVSFWSHRKLCRTDGAKNTSSFLCLKMYYLVSHAYAFVRSYFRPINIEYKIMKKVIILHWRIQTHWKTCTLLIGSNEIILNDQIR